MLGCKVICVRCINCSYTNIAKRTCLHDKIAFFAYIGKIHTSKSFESNTPLNTLSSETIIVKLLCQCCRCYMHEVNRCFDVDSICVNKKLLYFFFIVFKAFIIKDTNVARHL